jgi:quercetin dioxygenase-like cupin family protein
MPRRRGLDLGPALRAVLIVSAAAAQEPAKPEVVHREVVAGMPRGEQQDVQVLRATIAPGQSTGFHTHRFPVTVYVLDGAFTLEMEGRDPVTVRAGRSLVEPPNVRMTGYNRSLVEPTRVVIFYVSDPGTPFLDPTR